MTFKINNEEYHFDGYVYPINSLQKIAEKCYEQGKADAERDFQNSDYWNDYLAKVIADAKADAYEDAEKRLRYLWQQYEADKENVPKPQFTEAIALITMLELDAEEKSNE